VSTMAVVGFEFEHDQEDYGFGPCRVGRYQRCAPLPRLTITMPSGQRARYREYVLTHHGSAIIAETPHGNYGMCFMVQR